MNIRYDHEGAILEIRFDQTEDNAEYDEIMTDVFVRLTPDGHIAGVLILNLAQQILWQLRIPLVVTATMPNDDAAGE